MECRRERKICDSAWLSPVSDCRTPLRHLIINRPRASAAYMASQPDPGCPARPPMSPSITWRSVTW